MIADFPTDVQYDCRPLSYHSEGLRRYLSELDDSLSPVLSALSRTRDGLARDLSAVRQSRSQLGRVPVALILHFVVVFGQSLPALPY